MADPDDSAPRDSSLEMVSGEALEHIEHAEGLENEAAETGSAAARGILLVEAARVWEEQAGEPLRAIAAYAQVLEAEPLHREAYPAAERLCRSHEQWATLAGIYLRAAESMGEPADRIATYHRLAKVYEEGLRSTENAYNVLLRAFTEDVAHEGTAAELERVAIRVGKLNDLIGFCNQTLPNVTEDRPKVELCAWLGRWYIEACHYDYADACLNQALQIRPDHRRALLSLAALYKSQSKWEPLIQLLTHIASVATEAEHKRDALVSLGEVYEKQLNDPERASASYHAALQADPLCKEASDGLARTSQTEEGFAALAASLEQQLAGLEDAAQVISLCRELGEVYAQRLGDPVRAIAAYQRLVEHAPDDVRALKELDTLLAEQDRSEELAAVLEARVPLAASERERGTLQLRLAALLEERLDRPEDAIPRLEAVVGIDATNETALGLLERLYQGSKQWEELARTYSLHLEATEDPDVQLDLYQELALVQFERLDEPNLAIEALESAKRIDPTDVATLAGLATLYETVESWQQAKEALDRVVLLADSPRDVVEYRRRLAMILSGHLDDHRGAVSQLERAIDVDPTHGPSLSALKSLHEEKGKWSEAAVLLEQLQDLATDPSERATLLVELGSMNEQHLQDPPRAVECYELALDSDPESLDAMARLATLYVEQDRRKDAMPLLEKLVSEQSIEKHDRETVHGYHMLHGEVAEALGDHPIAMLAYKAAFALDPKHLPTLQSLARMQLANELWDKATKSFQMILVHHKDALGDGEKVDAYHGLGLSKLRLGERRKALNMFDKALQIDGSHVPTLEALQELHEEHGDWKEVVQRKKELLQTMSGDERAEALMEVAELCIAKLGDSQEAIDCVTEALEIQPSNVPMLHKLLELNTAAERWWDAIDAINRIIKLETNDQRIARYHRSIAVLYRDKLDEHDLAVHHFEDSLDKDATQLKNFEAIDALLTGKKEWERLEKAYRKMLQRIKGTGQTSLEAHLLHLLGEIYRTRMGRLEAAATAFEVANTLEPESREREVILAELYARMPDRLDKAVDKHQLLIRRDPTRLASYKALFALYRQMKQLDKAWCVSAALAFIGQADDEETLFYAQNKPLNVQRTPGALSPELWMRNLFAPEENLYVGKVFETILPFLRRSRVQPHKAYKLKKKNRVDFDLGIESLGGLFAWGARTLGMPPPELYIQDDQLELLAFAITDPPVSLVSGSLLAEHGPEDARFELGYHLSFYRGEHYVRCLEPGAYELRALVLAAINAVRPGTQVPTELIEEVGEKVAALQEGLTPVEVERLNAYVAGLLKKGEAVDINRWLVAADLTACRAGLLLCGNVATASRMLERRNAGGSSQATKEQVKHLLSFSITEGYFALRHAVGISIEDRPGF